MREPMFEHKVYCNQCAEMLDRPSGDFKGYTSPFYWKMYTLGAAVQCDGCGHIRVDPEGNRVSTPNASYSTKINEILN